MDENDQQKSVGEDDDDQNSALSQALLGVLISVFVINVIILLCLLVICLKKRKMKTSSAAPEHVAEHGDAIAVRAGNELNSVVTSLDPALLARRPDGSSARPSRSSPSTGANINSGYQMDQRDFYTQSLRTAAMNNWRNYSLTGTTGSATSLDSGLGYYTPKVNYGTKHKIRAKVHAEDDHSFTSESGNFEFRKLTLSESQNISEV